MIQAISKEKTTFNYLLLPMKNLYILFTAAILFTGIAATAQPVCVNNGNVMIFTNYDGGILNINADANIPNLKICVCSYEPVQVNLSGTYVGNITQVLYAGFNSTQNNNHCNQTNLVTSINGVPNNISQIITYPPADLQNPNGWPNIICAYQCDTIGNQGGCNTVDQVVSYFLNQTNGSLYAHYIQYGCWSSSYAISAGGNCCIQPQSNIPPPVASFTADTTAACPGQCFTFTNTSTGGPFTSFAWTFNGAVPPTSDQENPTFVCYLNEGVYPVSLTVTNANGSDTSTVNSFITIGAPAPTAQFTYLQVNNYLANFTNASTGATSYLWTFPGNVTSTNPNPSFNFPSEGNYTVTLIAYGPCTNDTIVRSVNIIKTAIEENPVFNGFNIYPNPGNNQLTISLAEAAKNIIVEIFDPMGKLVSQYINLSGNTFSFDTAPMAGGTYLVRVNVNGKQGKKVWVKI